VARGGGGQGVETSGGNQGRTIHFFLRVTGVRSRGSGVGGLTASFRVGGKAG
jgi:hypothetical protein